jgi:uncharacterized membrane protein HdeD (DUF308 family)
MKQTKFGAVVSPIVWNLLSVVLGGLMIAYNDQIIHWVLLFCGIYLTILGLLPILKALIEHVALPFPAILSLVCGVLLMIFNQTLAAIVFVLLGLLLFLVGLQQLNNFLSMRRQGLQLKWYYYLYPVLAIAAGVFTVCNPFDMTETLITFVGWCLVVHGLISVVGVVSTLFVKKSAEEEVVETIEIKDETSEETPTQE